MSEWKEVRLGDICDIYGRIGFRGYTTNDLVKTPEEGAISLSPSNIIQGEIDLSKCTFISWFKYEESPEIKIKEGDIIFVKTGSSYGNSALIRSVSHPMTLNPQLVVLKNIKANPIILSYVIKGHEFQGGVNGIIGGSAIPTLSQKNLANLLVRLPNKETQDKISSILSSLDDKIAVNRRICQNLEEQAQALFKHWFVDFAPFKDGKFVESELGMIPEGWRVGTLAELGDIVGGATPSKAENTYYTNNGIHWLTPKDLSHRLFKFTSRGEIDITEEGYKSCSTKLMPKGSVLFSSRAPIGYITIAKNDICTNQGFKSVVPKYAGTAYIYYLLKTNTKRIESISSGTTFKEVSGSMMKTLSVIIPPKGIIDKFEDSVGEIFKMQESKEEESSRLATIRDTLLPKLMSGQIKL